MSLANLTDKTVVILDDQGVPFVRIPAGETRVWNEPRVGANDEPPARDGLVRNWAIDGTADGEPFVIRGFLGYRPPPGAANVDEGSGLPGWMLVLALPAVLLILATLLLARRRRDT